MVSISTDEALLKSEDKKSLTKERLKPYRELTWAAVFSGITQGVLLNLAFVYAALKLGFSIGGSTVASIMGYAFLKGVLKKGTMVENNINQTIASGINTAGTGIVFTLPALLMLNAKWQADGTGAIEFSYGPFILAGIAGALMGVVMIIPLRKQMIELERLRFPSGIAVTTIIRSGSSGMSKAKLLGIGFLVSALWKILMISGVLHIEGVLAHEELNFGFGIIPEYLSPVLYLSLMNFAAGLLAGKGGLPFFAGGVLAWWFLSPLAVMMGFTPAATDGAAQAGIIYSQMLRPLGIGTLVGGALMGMVMAFPAIKGVFTNLANAKKIKHAGENGGAREETPMWAIISVSVIAFALFFAASYMVPGVGVGAALLSAVVGSVWLMLAGMIVAQATGMTDISPMSGMALISVTLMMFLLNNNVAAAMVVGVGVCVAIGQGADMMQDLKTGFMIGAQPFRQQLVQFCVTWIGAIISIGAIYLLWTAGEGGQGGFGEGTMLPAPQAGALMGIVDAITTGNVPFDKYGFGMVIGGLLGAAPMAGLGVLVGLAMYLPFSITFGYGLGCLSNMYLIKKKGHGYYDRLIVPLGAGLIVGEAILGIGHAAFEILV